MLNKILIRRLKKVLGQSDDLRREPWKGSKNSLEGHCYLASEVLYHILGGKSAGWKPMYLKVDGFSHWYLQHQNGEVLDPTESQFDEPVCRATAVGRGFLTKAPSKRAKILLKRFYDYM